VSEISGVCFFHWQKLFPMIRFFETDRIRESRYALIAAAWFYMQHNQSINIAGDRSHFGTSFADNPYPSDSLSSRKEEFTFRANIVASVRRRDRGSVDYLRFSFEQFIRA
jgi:hypothetical protein